MTNLKVVTTRSITKYIFSSKTLRIHKVSSNGETTSVISLSIENITRLDIEVLNRYILDIYFEKGEFVTRMLVTSDTEKHEVLKLLSTAFDHATTKNNNQLL